MGKNKVNSLIDEMFFRFIKSCNPENYLIQIRLKDEKIRRRFKIEEMMNQMNNNTKYGEYFRNIIMNSTSKVISLQVSILEKIRWGEKRANFDILQEMVSNTRFGVGFDERAVSLGIIVSMGAFLKN